MRSERRPHRNTEETAPDAAPLILPRGYNSNTMRQDRWPIDLLKLPARQTRKHPQKQINRLMGSIEEFGFIMPILVGSDGTVIAGAARLEAARQLDFKMVPVLVVEHLTPAQISAYRIADNRLAELSNWDEAALKLEFESILEIDTSFDLRFTGFDTPQIDLILQADTEEPVEETSPPVALATTAVSRVGDEWQLGRHRLLCGDACSPETLARLLPGEKARLVIIDPPFNVSVSGHVSGLGKTQHREFVQASGEMSIEEFAGFLTRALTCVKASLLTGGMALVFIDWRSVELVIRVGRELGFSLHNLIVWAKTNAGMGSLYRSQHELCCLFKLGSAKHVNNIMLGANGRNRSNVWTYAGVNTFGRNRMTELESHPTVKPVAMIADAIFDLSHRGEIVLDSFVGSGTTLIAAERTGRVARVMDLDPLYVDATIRRFEIEFGIEAVHAGTGLGFAEMARRRANEAATTPGDSDAVSEHPVARHRPRPARAA